MTAFRIITRNKGMSISSAEWGAASLGPLFWVLLHLCDGIADCKVWQIYLCAYYENAAFFRGIFCFGLDPLNANLCLNLISQELQLGLSLSCSCFWITSVPYRSQGSMGRFSVVVCLRGGKTGLWQVADARAVCRNKETWGSRLLWLWFSTKQNRAMAFSIYWGRGANTIKMEIAWVLEMLFEIVMSGK